MINSRELRLGNWVRQKSSLRKGEFFESKVNHITNDENYEDQFQNDYSPIPLSPEILIKCGFKKTGHFDYSFRKLILHDMTDTNIKCFEVYWEYPKAKMVVGNYLTVKHLHSLQNLYFSLLGYELQYTP